MGEIAGQLGGIEHVDVQEERRVARGGTVVRTTVGEVDARIATKLDRARSAVEAQLGS
jgi:flagellar assembly protein FliH